MLTHPDHHLRVEGDSENRRGHVLIAASGLSGILYSTVELGRRLRAAGHRVTYAGPGHARGLAEEHDLGFLALEPSRYEQFLESDATEGVLSRIVNLPSRREQAAAAVGVDSWKRAVRELEPDLLLIDGEMHEHIISSSVCSAPIALLNSFASIWRRPGLPPPHHRVRPGVGMRGTRGVVSMLWLALRLRKSFRAASQGVRRLGCDRISILRHLARQAGFDLGRETDASQWLIPFTYPRFPVLSLHAQEFEFPHRPPDRVHYVGPMVLESRGDHPMTPAAEAELETVFEQRRGAARRRLIYAGFGSVFSTKLDLLRRLAAVVAEHPDWDLVISLSDQVRPSDLGELPTRVHLFPWVPQLRVLQHADVAVTHGGINTLDECVLHEVPMLVYCGFETDMAGNTARVEHHGIGIAGDSSRDTREEMGLRLEALLHQPTYHDRVGRLRRAYISYAENRVAERVVESMIEGGSRFTDREGPASPEGAGS